MTLNQFIEQVNKVLQLKTVDHKYQAASIADRILEDDPDLNGANIRIHAQDDPYGMVLRGELMQNHPLYPGYGIRGAAFITLLNVKRKKRTNPRTNRAEMVIDHVELQDPHWADTELVVAANEALSKSVVAAMRTDIKNALKADKMMRAAGLTDKDVDFLYESIHKRIVSLPYNLAGMEGRRTGLIAHAEKIQVFLEDQGQERDGELDAYLKDYEKGN